MEAKLQLRIQRYGWDKAADHYDRYWQQQLKPAQDLLMEMSDLQKGQRVLEIASGTGTITFEASEIIGDEGFILATDISDKMIESTEIAAKKMNRNNIEFRRMSAEEMDLEENSFDRVLCSLGLMYVVDPPESLKKFYNVLRKNGKCISSVWGDRNNCGWSSIFPVVESRVKTDVCPMFFQLGTKEILKLNYEMAGFKNVVFKKIKTTLYYDNAEDACGAAFAGGPVAMAYSRFDDKTKKEAFEEYSESIERFKKNGKYEIPGEFVVCSGEKV